MVHDDNQRNSARDAVQKKIHINLTEEVHRKLRIKCALEDSSIQEFVSEIITNSVRGIKVVESGEKEVG